MSNLYDDFDLPDFCQNNYDDEYLWNGNGVMILADGRPLHHPPGHCSVHVNVNGVNLICQTYIGGTFVNANFGAEGEGLPGAARIRPVTARDARAAARDARQEAREAAREAHQTARDARAAAREVRQDLLEAVRDVREAARQDTRAVARDVRKAVVRQSAVRRASVREAAARAAVQRQREVGRETARQAARQVEPEVQLEEAGVRLAEAQPTPPDSSAGGSADEDPPVHQAQEVQEEKIVCRACRTIRKKLETVFISAKCVHVFCKECMGNIMKSEKQCPTCKTFLLESQNRRLYF